MYCHFYFFLFNHCQVQQNFLSFFLDDKTILTGIVENINGKTNYMQGIWQLENIPATSFSQVSKDFLKDAKGHVLFIDENLLQKSLFDNLIQCLDFDQDTNVQKFVLKQPRFKRMKRGN